jgi:transposase InsO family protein
MSSTPKPDPWQLDTLALMGKPGRKRIQHYKERSPRWIKLHRKTLDDYEFQCLPLASIEPGSPWENGYCESFNGMLKDECLNVHWFQTMAEAKQLIEAWLQEYNGSRPHRALGDLTPN